MISRLLALRAWCVAKPTVNRYGGKPHLCVIGLGTQPNSRSMVELVAKYMPKKA
jgi:hypothetical protein